MTPKNLPPSGRNSVSSSEEGVAIDPSAQTEIVPLLRFHSSTQDSLTTLAEYVSRMVPDQDEIYYLIANDVTSAKQSPHPRRRPEPWHRSVVTQRHG
jgi:hypothetical protein